MRNPLVAAVVLEARLRAEQVRAIWAKNDEEAAGAIAGFVSGPVIVNKSAAVKEITPALSAVGINPILDYPGRSLPDVPSTLHYGWELPDDAAALGWGTFSRTRLAGRPEGAPGLRQVTALLGVSAAGGDGCFLWIQHMENVSRALALAGRLVLLVPIDKVLPSAAEAELQLAVTAAYGWSARLLDLSGTKGSPEAGTDSVRAGVEPALQWDEANMVSDREILVVILDNSRTDWVDTPEQDLLRCLSCRACRVDCPTQRYFEGDLQMSPVEYLRFFLQGLHSDLSLCVGCGACARACPMQIDIPFLISRRRAEEGVRTPVRERVLMNPALVGRVGRRLLKGTPGGGRVGRLGEVVGVHRDVRTPPFSRRSFNEWLEQRNRDRSEPQDATAPAVFFYPGCFVEYNDLEQGQASVRLLEAAGYRVESARTSCCEIPRLQAGDWEKAKERARRNLDLLEQRAADAEAVVTGCPSCARALTRFYPELLPQAGWLTEGVRDLFSFLVSSPLLPVSADPSRSAASARGLRILYHAPCHYPDVDPELSVLKLLHRFGADVIQADRGCCGMSGSFGLKSRYHDLSVEVGRSLFERIRSEDDRSIVTNCGACGLQIRQGTGRIAEHPAITIDRLVRGEVA
ncbi:MAG: hypothetical protein Kow00129_07540 [Thermoleophilia bacterium]